MRARPLSNWPRVYCARESPVVCTFDSIGRFLSLQSLSLFFGNRLLSAKKRKDHCERATGCSFAKHLPPKNAMAFFAFAKLPNHWLFGIPLPKI